MAPVLGKERDRSRRGSRHDLSLPDDHGGHGVQRNRFRKPRAERVQTVAAGGQRAASRFAETQRLLSLLQLVQRGVSTYTQRFGLRTAALRALVQLRAVDGPRRLTACRDEKLPLVALKDPAFRPREDDRSDRPAAGYQRDHDVPLAQLRNGLGRGPVIHLTRCVGRHNQDLAPSNGVVQRRPFDDR